MTHKIALIVALCLVAPLTMAQEIPTRESFSLLDVLKGIGYGPFTSSVIPLKSEEDLARAIRGEEPREVLTQKEFFWPFSETAASPNLSVMAVALDSRAFPNNPAAKRTAAIISLPDRAGVEPKLLWSWIPDDMADAIVKSVAFMSETMIRVGVQTKSETSGLGYANDYYFADITERQNAFVLSTLLQDRGPIHHTRAFSDRIYAISYGDPQNPMVEVISVDPIKKKIQPLLQMLGGKEVVSSFMHGVVNLPGRDVWDMGDGNLKIFYSKNVNGEWKRFAVEIFNGGRAARIVKAEYSQDTPYRAIEGTDRFVQRYSENELIVEDGVKTVLSDRTVSPWQSLRKVSKGFVGEEANHPNYSTFLYENGEAPQLLWEDRLIHSVHKDGGFLGISSNDKANGDIHAVRVIYDRESLLGGELNAFAEAKDCAAQLLARIGKSAGRKKK